MDTNVLVRILVDEPSQPAQVSQARAVATEAATVHVPLIVLVETIWVLETAYRLPKTALVEALAHITGNEAFDLEHADRCDRALDLFRESRADFADCVILAGCSDVGLTLHTFDRRLGQLTGAMLVS